MARLTAKLATATVGPVNGTKYAIVRPNRGALAGPPCIYMHTNSSDATEVFGAGGVLLPSITKKLQALADTLGFTILALTTPNTYFGKGAIADGTTSWQGVVTAGIAWHKANLLGDNVPAVLIGASGGSIGVARRCGLDPSNIACAVTFLSVWDLNAVVANDLGSNRSGVNTAYGRSVGDASAFSAGICPVHGFSDTVPKLIVYGASDGFMVSTGHNTPTEMASGRGATFASVTGAHDDASVSNYSTASFLSFIDAYT